MEHIKKQVNIALAKAELKKILNSFINKIYLNYIFKEGEKVDVLKALKNEMQKIETIRKQNNLTKEEITIILKDLLK